MNIFVATSVSLAPHYQCFLGRFFLTSLFFILVNSDFNFLNLEIEWEFIICYQNQQKNSQKLPETLE